MRIIALEDFRSQSLNASAAEILDLDGVRLGRAVEAGLSYVPYSPDFDVILRRFLDQRRGNPRASLADLLGENPDAQGSDLAVLYVAPDGLDSNSGFDRSRPMRTVDAAVQRARQGQPTRIELDADRDDAGNPLATDYVLTQTITNGGRRLTAPLALVGPDSTSPQLGSGSITANLSSFEVTVDGAVGPAMIGKTFRVTSGPLAGYRRTIHSISGSDVTLMMPWATPVAADPGLASYVVEEPAVRIVLEADANGNVAPLCERISTDRGLYIIDRLNGATNVLSLANLLLTTDPSGSPFASIGIPGSTLLANGLEVLKDFSGAGEIYGGLQGLDAAFRFITPTAVVAGAVDQYAWTGWGLNATADPGFGFRIQDGLSLQGVLTCAGKLAIGGYSCLTDQQATLLSANINHAGLSTGPGVELGRGGLVFDTFFQAPPVLVAATAGTDAPALDAVGALSTIRGGTANITQTDFQGDGDGAAIQVLSDAVIQLFAGVTGSGGNAGAAGVDMVAAGSLQALNGLSIDGGTPGTNDFRTYAAGVPTDHDAATLVAGAAGYFDTDLSGHIFRSIP